MDVELLRWPSERSRREQLRASGRPRLLLLNGKDPAPPPSDSLEDWIRIPADRADVRARIDSLVARANEGLVARATEGLVARANEARRVEPFIDDTGSLCSGTHRIALPPIEAAILAELIGREGKVVSRADLVAAVWPNEPPDRNVLDVHLVRLRRRVAEADLRVRTIRSRGLLLERS